MKNLVIQNREWFDKGNANTYFSAEVWLDNDLIMRMPLQYGYDEMCRQILMDKLVEHFKVTGYYEVREALKRHDIKLSVYTTDSKKRDLYKGEKFENLAPLVAATTPNQW